MNQYHKTFKPHPRHPPIKLLMLDYTPSKDNLIAMGDIMESESIPDAPLFFNAEPLTQGHLLMMNLNEVRSLNVNGNTQSFIPFVQLGPDQTRTRYGLMPTDAFTHGSTRPPHKHVPTETILTHPLPKLSVVLYACFPKDRNELGTLRVKFDNQWVMKKNRVFELPILGRSRRERFDSNLSARLTKDGDTPQGIYQIHGTFFTVDKKFGTAPRIDIDGMKPPLNLFGNNPKAFSELVPAKSFFDYWVHEFPMAYMLGRYLLRMHDNSVDPNFPNTYTTPVTQKTYRATAGCINFGKNIGELLQLLADLDVLDPCHLNTSNYYGRLNIINKRSCHLIVLDM